MPTQDQEPKGFEASLRALEDVTSALETGQLDLDASLAAFERGIRLLSQCKGLLDQAEKRVALLTGVDEQGQPETAPFESSPTAGPTASPESKPDRANTAKEGFDDLPF